MLNAARSLPDIEERKMRLLLALSALLLFACEKEVPRYPDTKVYPETKTVTPPPAATESKPGETKQVEKPQK
jgi:hypothetical protein